MHLCAEERGMKKVSKKKTKDYKDINGYYSAVKKCPVINPIDYEFLIENYKLSKKDIKSFLSKPVDNSENNAFTNQQFIKWIIDFVQRCDRHPTLKDYYDFENIISSY